MLFLTVLLGLCWHEHHGDLVKPRADSDLVGPGFEQEIWVRECPRSLPPPPARQTAGWAFRKHTGHTLQNWPALACAAVRRASSATPAAASPGAGSRAASNSTRSVPAGGLGNPVSRKVPPGTSDWWSQVTWRPTAAGETGKCSFLKSTWRKEPPMWGAFQI